MFTRNVCCPENKTILYKAMHHQNSIPFRFYGYTQHRETHSDESTLPLPYPDFDCMAVATFLKMAGLKPHHDVQQPSKKKKKNKSSSDGRKHENESTATRDQYCSDTDPLPRLWLHRLPILESIPSEEQQQQQQADRTRRCKWDPSRTIDGDASKIIQALEEYLAEQKQVYRDWESTHNSAVSSSSDENVGGDSDGFEVISIVDEDRSRRDGAAKSAQQGIKADGILLLNDLDQEQRARLAAIESVVKEKLLACVIHQWFANDANYDNTTYSSYRHQAKGILVKLFLPRWIRNRRLAQMANLLHVDHPGQVSMLHCFALLKECLDLIDDVLGDKSFLFSNDTYVHMCMSCMFIYQYHDSTDKQNLCVAQTVCT